MTDKTLANLTQATTIADGDLLPIFPNPGGPLKSLAFSTFKGLVLTALGSSYLQVANNLLDVANASQARTNLGLKAAAILDVGTSTGQVMAADDSRVSSLATMAYQTASAVAITGGSALGLSDVYATRFRSVVDALSALNIDCSAGDHCTKSISANSTFTVSNVPSGAFGFSLRLTITSAAVPTWFSGVKWPNGTPPTLGNGVHLLFFFTDDGGTNWYANLARAFA